MSRNRWLTILLLVSWTLNVALVVALFTGSRHSKAPPFSRERMTRRSAKPMQGLGKGIREQFREELAPLQQERIRLMADISETFAASELDTVKLSGFSDSLNSIRAEIQKRLISHLTSIHSELSPKSRRRLSKRIFGMLDGKKGRMKHGRFKSDSHFQPDSI